MPLLLCLIYLAGHLALYLALPLFRDWPVLDTEKGIFSYHLTSVVVLTGAFGSWAAVGHGTDSWIWLISVVLLHGIYSLSFLELWALADDSYSLAIMDAVERSDGAPITALKGTLEAIGTRKQASRLHNLKNIGLVREDSDGSVALTAIARIVLLAARGFLFLVNIRKYG